MPRRPICQPDSSFYVFYTAVLPVLISYDQKGAFISGDSCALCLKIVLRFWWNFTTSDIFRSTPKSRPNNMGQMSVRPQKVFSDSDEIWYVGRGR